MKTCKQCGNDISSKWAKTFCSMSCAGLFNNHGRITSDETKVKQRNAALKWHNDNPNKRLNGDVLSKLVGEGTKGKFRKDIPDSIMELSTRTVSKILKRIKLACSLCGWNEAICDIHHINGRKVADSDGHWNLTYICPNCHRKYHSGLIEKMAFISLDVYIGDRWKQYYYG